MAEHTSMKLNPESHLLLEQPLLRLPYELSRKNFKTAQKHLEREREHVLITLKASANASLVGSQTPDQALTSLDMLIARMTTLKRKLEGLHGDEDTLHRQSRRRIEHLQQLYDVVPGGLGDVAYEEWSRVRLDRLLIDYLLRNGYGASARALARERGIEDLVDLDVFEGCWRVAESLREGRTAEALAWCAEHRPLMKRTNTSLEFQLRFQQFIELRRADRLLEARQHAQKYLTGHAENQAREIHVAAALLAFPPTTQAMPYKDYYSPSRWTVLADLFTKTHHELFSLPAQPLLHIALSAGLSALKTPSCHSRFRSSSSNARSSATSVCPICSTELNELARKLPYAQHSKSLVEHDPVVLPNGRIYGFERLAQLSTKAGMPPERFKDPTTGEVFSRASVRKVFIS